MVNYYELGPDKQLNEIVVAGSHDAGITRGKKNVRTQKLNIGRQARAGVRVFDLRIAAAAAGKHGGSKAVELRAFHADKKLMQSNTKRRHVADVGRLGNVKRTKLKGGAFGLGLSSMLQDAKAFVEGDLGRTEFLILKFDKCLNWPLIAESCRSVLGSALYRGGGNLNTALLRDLQGKVIVLFSSEGFNTLGHGRAREGILRFKNLFSGGAYSTSFAGLQYYGKGGTSVKKPKKKIRQNVKKQGRLMEGAKLLGNPEVMGMMYWTTTGVFESIEKRNARMWHPPNVERFKKLWARGLAEFVEFNNPFRLPPDSPAVGPIRKRFMPNIVMIDFADTRKCLTIRDLNDLSPDALAALGQEG